MSLNNTGKYLVNDKLLNKMYNFLLHNGSQTANNLLFDDLSKTLIKYKNAGVYNEVLYWNLISIIINVGKKNIHIIDMKNSIEKILNLIYGNVDINLLNQTLGLSCSLMNKIQSIY